VSTPVGVAISLVVLGAAGFVPTLWLVGRRWTLLPLSILSGAVVTAVAATCFLAIGGSLMGWFFGLSVVAAFGCAFGLAAQSRQRHKVHLRSEPMATRPEPSHREQVVRFTTALALVGAGIWCLRGLRTPMVGLDTRLFWFLRAGWWLWPHSQALANMHNIGADTHAGYPPLISSTVAAAWWISGNQSDRIGTVLIAAINVCALVAGAWALVELGSSIAARITAQAAGRPGPERSKDDRSTLSSLVAELPLWCGAGVAILLVFTFFGVTATFATNGYADPLWSVAAAGAVTYLLMVPAHRAGFGTAVILLAVAGESKVEGTATVIGIVAIVGLRAVLRSDRGRSFAGRVGPTLALAAGAVIALVAWPVVMRFRHVGADVNTSGPRQAAIWQRSHGVYDSMAPHLHVLLLAAALSIAGAFLLARVRSALSIGTDLWAWAALVVGLAVIVGAYVIGPGTIYFLDLWLETSAHRVAEFPALMAWWIIASTVVIGSSAPSVLLRSAPPEPDAREEPLLPVGIPGE
jgi:hypothetical protein